MRTRTPARSSTSSPRPDLLTEVAADDDWAGLVAERLIARLNDQPSLRLCLPTGSTPVPAYAAFAAAGGSLSKATVVLLDEFLLPHGSPARCDAMLERDLLALLAGPPRHLVTWDTDATPAVACAAMEDEVAKGLDLAIVGLGANGHIGTNEPGSDITSRSRLVELDASTSQGALRYGAEQPPSQAMTLGVGSLLEADEIWLLVTGRHKSAILDRTLHGPITPGVPASLLQTHRNVVVMADRSAWDAD